jgi:hypothetical protein
MPHEEISKLLERIAQQFEGLMQKSSNYEENICQTLFMVNI